MMEISGLLKYEDCSKYENKDVQIESTKMF